MGNFTFLEDRWSDLARLGELSEKYVYSDPNTSVIKQGMLAEVMVKYMLAYDGIKEPDYDNTHANRIRLLKRNDLLPHEIDNTLYILRKDRNNAAHDGADEGASKALAGWPSPQGMEQDLERDIAEADRKLGATGYELLEDSNGLGLRYYQIEAVKAAEKAIAEHKNTVLLAMATGTGKTRTVLGMIYRFLSAKQLKRILYLVDRTALGDQTMDTFKEVKLEDLKTLNQLYDIKDLGEKEFEKS